MDIKSLLTEAVEKKASDIFIVAGLPVSFKVHDKIRSFGDTPIPITNINNIIDEIYVLAQNRCKEKLQKTGDDDFSFSLPGISRFRVSTYKQRGSLAAVIRVVNAFLPNPEELGLPTAVLDLAERTKGLVLVTGTAGSGKSTTLACLIDKINNTRHSHIITLEDPLEYLHSHKKSIVSQREISSDTTSFVSALRAALRQAPDVVLLGEMRDIETISTAMTASETGHLVFSTLHTLGAANTIDRVIDAFPPGQQQQIRVQLSMVLQAVVSQQLIPTLDGKVAPAFEIMICNNAIRNMIREAKIHQMDSVIFSSSKDGMISMDASILELYRQGRISDQDAIKHSVYPDMMTKNVYRL